LSDEDGKLLLGLGGLFRGVLGGLVEGSSLLNGGVGVELEHCLDVLERVLLDRRSLGRGSSGLEGGLDFVGLEDSLKIGVGQDRARHRETLLVGGGVDGVERLERVGGVDGESTDVSAGGEFEEVELVDGEEGDAGDVSHGLDDAVVVLVDDERAPLLDSSSVSHFTASGSESSGLLDSVDVVDSADGLEHADGGLGLLESLGGAVDDKWEFRNSRDDVTLGHGEGRNASSSDGGDGGVSSLSDVHSSMPVAPGLVWVEHSTASAHVSESGGTRSGSTTSTDSGNTSDSSASTPRFGRSLLTSFGGNSVRLASVLGNVGVHELDNVSSDGSLNGDL
jgi:hypothetical protein